MVQAAPRNSGPRRGFQKTRRTLTSFTPAWRQQMAKMDAVDVLNELVHTSEDGEKGFNEAARIAQDPKLILMFQECAQQCHGAVTALQAKVSALGGKPDDRGSVAGAAHRGWVKAKAA